MKTRILFFLLLLSNTLIFAQEKTELEEKKKSDDSTLKVEIVKNSSFEEANTYGKNEFTLNIFSLIAFKTVDISYERILNPSNSFGISVLIKTNSTDINDDGITTKFEISPYYRFYFLNRKDYGSKGFFFEVYTAFSSIEETIYTYTYNENSFYYSERSESDPESILGIAFGAGIGKKWINRKGASIELLVGIGTYLSGPQDTIHGKLGVTIGKRF